MLLMTLLAMHGCTEIKQSRGEGIWGVEKKKKQLIEF